MLRYQSGDNVKAGFYWNKNEWEAHIVKPEGGVLPGEKATYIRLPLLAVLILAPVMGAVYAMFLPFIGFAMVAAYLTGRLRRVVTTTPPAAERRAPVTAPQAAKNAAGRVEAEEQTRKAA